MFEPLDVPIDLWFICRIIALINNIFCYFWLFKFICVIIVSVLCTGCQLQKDCHGFCENNLISNRILSFDALFNLITNVAWCILIVLMIINNHKLRSTGKPGASVIYNWLLTHCIFLAVIIILDIVPGLFGLYNQTIYANGFVLVLLILTELYIVYQFYKERA